MSEQLELPFFRRAISCSADFRAKTSAELAKEPASRANDPACGSNSEGSSKRSGRRRSSSKTSRAARDVGCAACGPICTLSDIERGPAASASTTAAGPTSESGSSFWPTPSAVSYGSNRGGAAGRVGPIRPSLAVAARLWATPTSSKNANRSTKTRPSEHDGRGHGGTLAAQVRGSLNPRWTLALMGFPLEWLDGLCPKEPRNAPGSRRGARRAPPILSTR